MHHNIQFNDTIWDVSSLNNKSNWSSLKCQILTHLLRLWSKIVGTYTIILLPSDEKYRRTLIDRERCWGTLFSWESIVVMANLSSELKKQHLVDKFDL